MNHSSQNITKESTRGAIGAKATEDSTDISQIEEDSVDLNETEVNKSSHQFKAQHGEVKYLISKIELFASNKLKNKPIYSEEANDPETTNFLKEIIELHNNYSDEELLSKVKKIYDEIPNNDDDVII
jgi:hypothetical protein